MEFCGIRRLIAGIWIVGRDGRHCNEIELTIKATTTTNRMSCVERGTRVKDRWFSISKTNIAICNINSILKALHTRKGMHKFECNLHVTYTIWHIKCVLAKILYIYLKSNSWDLSKYFPNTLKCERSNEIDVEKCVQYENLHINGKIA